MGTDGAGYLKRDQLVAAGILPQRVLRSLCATIDLAWLPIITSKDDLRVYLCLAAHATKRTRESWPSKERISREVGVYGSNIRKAFRALAEVGAIATERRRDEAGDETTSLHKLLRPTRSASEESRTAFVALDWVRRIDSVRALRVFIALCAHADFKKSVVRGVGRSDLAGETGLHKADIPKALRELEIISAITTIPEPGEKAIYTIQYPPEAFYRGSSAVREKALMVSGIAQEYVRKGVRFRFHIDKDDRKIRLQWVASASKAPWSAARDALLPYVNGAEQFPTWAILYDVLADSAGVVSPEKKPRMKACT